VAHFAHLPVWEKEKDFEIVAVAESNHGRATVAQSTLPDARIYSDFTKLLEREDIDFVDICTPPCYHAEMVRAACNARKHVFCEKPLTTHAEDLEKLMLASETSKKVIFTVNNWKHAPIYSKTRQLIREGTIGTVRWVKIFVLRPAQSGGGCFDWRKNPRISGGGILVDHGWHNLYLVLSLVSEEPRSLSAKIGFPSGDNGQAEDNVRLDLEFSNSQAKLFLTWRARKRRNVGAVIGDKGSILIKDDHLIVKKIGEPDEYYSFSESLSGGSHHKEWMEPVVSEFRLALEDLDHWRKNFIEAQWCARLIQLAYRSQQEPSKCIQISECSFIKENGN